MMFEYLRGSVDRIAVDVWHHAPYPHLHPANVADHTENVQFTQTKSMSARIQFVNAQHHLGFPFGAHIGDKLTG